MLFNYRALCLAPLVLFATLSYADDINITGSQELPIPISPQTKASFSLKGPASSLKTIKLLTLSLSPEATAMLLQREATLLASPQPTAVSSNGGIQLGMNGVPVLDQGQHGTCATFAAVAAVEAASPSDKQDVSPLCQLQLGNYLAKNSYLPGGWDGSFGHVTLTQISSFGVMTQQQQRTFGCGGLTSYPLLDERTPEGFVTPEEFRTHSQLMPFRWFPLLHVSEIISQPINPTHILARVKKAISSGDRLIFGSLLVDVDLGVAGATGHNHTFNDSWVLSDKIRRDFERGEANIAGHEMIITGFDDGAVAIDNAGKRHLGLLTLRNSWSSQAGDHGEFYMSYDYFMNFAIEVHQIHADPAKTSS